LGSFQKAGCYRFGSKIPDSLHKGYRCQWVLYFIGSVNISVTLVSGRSDAVDLRVVFASEPSQTVRVFAVNYIKPSGNNALLKEVKD
jgi:hypothetical protein